MTVLANKGTSGTSGATVAATDTGAGNPWDLVNLGTGGAITYDSAHTFHSGAVAVKFVPGSAGNTSLQWSQASLGVVTELSGQPYCYFTANPVGGNTYLVRGTSAGATAFRVAITTTGKVALLDAGGTQIAVTTQSIPLNAPFRVAWHAVASTTAGTLEASIVSASGGDSTTILDSASSTSAALTATFNAVQYGPANGTPTSGTYWAGDFLAATGPSAYPFGAAGYTTLAGPTAATATTAAPTGTVRKSAGARTDPRAWMQGVWVLRALSSLSGGTAVGTTPAGAVSQLTALNAEITTGLATPGVVGFCARIAGCALYDDAAGTVFNSAALDAAKALADSYGVRFVPRVMLGVYTPASVITGGNYYVDTSQPAGFQNVPVGWQAGTPAIVGNPSFEAFYARLLRDFGNWCRANAIPLMHLSWYSFTFSELHGQGSWLSAPVPAFATGLTVNIWRDAHKRLIDLAAAAIGADLSVEYAVSGTWPNSQTAWVTAVGQLFDYAQTTLGNQGRLFIQANGWGGSDATLTPPSPPAVSAQTQQVMDVLNNHTIPVGLQAARAQDYVWDDAFAMAKVGGVTATGIPSQLSTQDATYVEVYAAAFDPGNAHIASLQSNVIANPPAPAWQPLARVATASTPGTILNSVGQTTSLRWNVNATVGQTVNLRWTVLTAVGDTVSLRWNVNAAVGKTVNVQWNVTGNVGQTVALRWNVLANLTPVGQTVQLVWNVPDPGAPTILAAQRAGGQWQPRRDVAERRTGQWT